VRLPNGQWQRRKAPKRQQPAEPEAEAEPEPNVISEIEAAAAEVEFARKVIEMNAKYAAEGRGSFQIDGKMIDIPIVVRAEKLLCRHEKIRAREARTLEAAS
jgi:hypothetical protein